MYFLALLKALFITILFGVFGCQFAYPSIKKFFQSGVLTDKTWARRGSEDSPSVTICAQNKISSYGWKETGNPDLRFKIPAFEMFCNDTENVEKMLDCMDKKTFNLSETVLDAESEQVTFVKKDKEFWTEDITHSYFGRMFKSLHFNIIL